MTNISGINNGKINWEALRNAAVEATKGAQNVDGIAPKANLVMKEVDGQVNADQRLFPPTPVLTAPVADAEQPAELDSAISKLSAIDIHDVFTPKELLIIQQNLQNLVDDKDPELKAKVVDYIVSETGCTIEEALQALMQLLQKLKDSMRLIRAKNAEMTQQIKQNQAEATKSAAFVTLIGGLVVSALQFANSAYQLKTSVAGMSQESQLMQEYGVSDAAKNCSRIESEIKNATAELETLEPPEVPNAAEPLNENQNAVEQINEQQNVAEQINENDINNEQQNVAEQINENNINNEQQIVENNNVNVEEQQIVENNNVNVEEQQIVAENNNNVNVEEQPQNVENNNQQVEALEGGEQPVDEEVNEGEQVAENGEEPVQGEEQNVEGDEGGKQQKIAELKARIRDLNGKLEEAEGKLQRATKAMEGDPRYKEAVNAQKKASLRNDLGNAFGQLGQAVVKGHADLLQAKAQGIAAEETRAQEAQDQSKDAFEKIDESYKSGLDTLKAVNSSKAQSEQAIIGNM